MEREVWMDVCLGWEAGQEVRLNAVYSDRWTTEGEVLLYPAMMNEKQ
jgi:hypothetical protein